MVTNPYAGAPHYAQAFNERPIAAVYSYVGVLPGGIYVTHGIYAQHPITAAV